MYCFMQHYLRPYYEKKKRINIQIYVDLEGGECFFC